VVQHRTTDPRHGRDGAMVLSVDVTVTAEPFAPMAAARCPATPFSPSPVEPLASRSPGWLGELFEDQASRAARYHLPCRVLLAVRCAESELESLARRRGITFLGGADPFSAGVVAG